MRRHLGTILAIALVVVVFGYVLPKVANYREVLDLLQSIDGTHLALLEVDGERLTAKIERVDYDVETVAREAVAAGLPGAAELQRL